jgi:hypothetical protein
MQAAKCFESKNGAVARFVPCWRRLRRAQPYRLADFLFCSASARYAYQVIRVNRNSDPARLVLWTNVNRGANRRL